MDAIQGFDVAHQLFRLRNAKSMSEAEVTTIMRALAENVKTYDQIVEVCGLCQSDFARHLTI